MNTLDNGTRITKKSNDWQGVIEGHEPHEYVDGNIIYDIRFDDPGLDNEWLARNEFVIDGEEDKRTPEVWCRIMDVKIADPDGWRGRDALPWDEPITRESFKRRMSVSTIEMWSLGNG